MKKFRVWINQYDMGTFEGIDEANALDQYARDAGYQDWKSIEEPSDEVEVFEV